MITTLHTRRRLGGLALAALLALAPAAAIALELPQAARTQYSWTGDAVDEALTVTVVAEELPLDGADGTPAVTAFSTSYLARPDAARPVIFFWNGGPGAAAVGLHPTFAPRSLRAAPADPAQRGSIDNPDSLIDAADLVFVDPVGTGYSRVLREGAGADHWGVEQDARSAAQFVRAWLQRHGREASPVVMVGQSYSGIRVPLAAKLLLDALPDLDLRGMLLVSPSTGGPRADALDDAARAQREWRRCAANLTVFAQTAAFYGRGILADSDADSIARELEALVSGREGFAADEHARVAGLIGFDPQQVAAADGCVATQDFQKGLLADRGDRVGTADTRLHAPLAITETRQPPYNDPSTSPYTLDYDLDAAWDHYLRNEIGYRPVSDYVRLSLTAHGAWDWNWPEWAGDSTASVLAALLERRPALRILVAVGYYDLSVPYLEPLRVFNASGLPGARFRIERYHAGHAVHSDAAERARSFGDLRALVGEQP